MSTPTAAPQHTLVTSTHSTDSREGKRKKSKRSVVFFVNARNTLSLHEATLADLAVKLAELTHQNNEGQHNDNSQLKGVANELAKQQPVEGSGE